MVAVTAHRQRRQHRPNGGVDTL